MLEAASEEDKEYFSEFSKIYVNKEKQIDCKRESESLRRDRERIEACIRLTDKSRYNYYFQSRSGRQSPRTVFFIIWFLTLLYSVPTFFGVFEHIENSGTAIFFAVICGLSLIIGLGCNYGIVYPRMKIIKGILLFN